MFPTSIEFVAVIGGVLVFWLVVFRGEKDIFDNANISFPVNKWIRNWIIKKWDNILLHFVISFFFLFMGVSNLQAWLGDSLKVPSGLDEMGAAGFIGFSGSFIADAFVKLAKIAKIIRTKEELMKDLDLKE